MRGIGGPTSWRNATLQGDRFLSKKHDSAAPTEADRVRVVYDGVYAIGWTRHGKTIPFRGGRFSRLGTCSGYDVGFRPEVFGCHSAVISILQIDAAYVAARLPRSMAIVTKAATTA